MRIFVITDLNKLPVSFVELLDTAELDCIFLGFGWFKNLGDSVASRNGCLKLLCLEDSGGTALALLPLWLRSEKRKFFSINHLSGLTNYYTPTFDLIWNSNKITKVEALGHLLQEVKSFSSDWHVFDLSPLTSTVKNEFHNALNGAGASVFPYFVTSNSFQLIDSSLAEYLAGRPSRVRNTVQRKLKKLNKQGNWQLSIFRTEEGLQEQIDAYHHVYNGSWKNKEPYPEFIDGLCKLAARKGWLRLGLIRIQGEPVAAQIWLVANGSAYIYKLAYDEHFKKYSPGTVLTHAMIECVIGQDSVKKVDFLTGEDNFKKEWMDSYQNLYGVQVVNLKSMQGFCMYIVNKISSIRKFLVEKYYKVKGKKNDR